MGTLPDTESIEKYWTQFLVKNLCGNILLAWKT